MNILIFLFVIIITSNIYFVVFGDTSTKKNNNNFIIAESDGGLSNRLRVLISHLYLAELLHNNAHLVFIWDVNEACPGHFLQIFKPIPSVTFISSEKIKADNKFINSSSFNNSTSYSFLSKFALKIYPKSRDGFEQTMLNYDVNLIVKKYRWWKIQLRLWELIIPTREIEEKVEQYVIANSVCNITSMHIRKTDMDLDIARSNPKRRINYDLFYKWIEKQKNNEPVYLMTDNYDTQQLFQSKYSNDKIYVYSNITNPLLLSSSLQSLPIDHRFTSLEHTIIDILIAAHARDFRTSPFSSVSDLVKMFNFLHRWQWCGCTFRGC